MSASRMASIFARSRPAAIGGAGIDPDKEGRYMASHYRYFRNRRKMPARAALEAARALPADYVQGREYYGSSGSVGAPFKDGSDTVRHVDKWAQLGLRFVGNADELVRLDHTGWFTDEDGFGETLRGGVWQLPAHKGRVRLLYGYREIEGRSEMNPGSAVLCVSHIVDEPADDSGNIPEEAVKEAARFADGLAESAAEEARDYRAVYKEGEKAAEADEEAMEARKELLPLLAEMRTFRREYANGRALPSVGSALLARVESLLETIREKRAERDISWRDCPGQCEEPWKAGFMDRAANGFVRAVRLGYAKASDWQGAPESNPCNVSEEN